MSVGVVHCLDPQGDYWPSPPSWKVVYASRSLSRTQQVVQDGLHPTISSLNYCPQAGAAVSTETSQTCFPAVLRLNYNKLLLKQIQPSIIYTLDRCHANGCSLFYFFLASLLSLLVDYCVSSFRWCFHSFVVSCASPLRPNGRPSAAPATHSFLSSRERFHLCRSDIPAGPLHRIQPKIESRRNGEPAFHSIFNILTFNPRHHQTLSLFLSLSLSFSVSSSSGPNEVALLHWIGYLFFLGTS